MTTKTLRQTVAAVMIALVAGLIVVSASSSASAAKTRVISKKTSISVSEKRVERGDTVRVKGRTTSLKRVVVIQKFRGGKWKRVKKVTARSGRYSVHVPVSKGTNRFRAVAKRRKVNQNLVLKKRVSRVVRVKGVAPKRAVVPAPEPSPPVVVPVDPTALSEATFLVRTYINNHRKSIGLSEKYLQNNCLAAFAASHSNLMASNELFEHSDSPLIADVGGVPVDSVCSTEANFGRGEVIALVDAATPQEAARAAVDAWLLSPAHRATLEEAISTGLQIGVGMAETSDGYFWVTAATAYNW